MSYAYVWKGYKEGGVVLAIFPSAGNSLAEGIVTPERTVMGGGGFLEIILLNKLVILLEAYLLVQDVYVRYGKKCLYRGFYHGAGRYPGWADSDHFSFQHRAVA